MICYPNAKINLGLKITSKRDDGFHNIDSCFLPISLFDVLEVKKQLASVKETTITYSGFNCNYIANDLVIRAYHILKNDFELGPVRVHLHKNIPFGSGLGGGSSDGAFMLIILNKLFHLNLSEIQLFNYAKILGSDCPFFIINRVSHVSSVGDAVKPIDFSLKDYCIVILKPSINCSTKHIFSQYKINKRSNQALNFNRNPQYWKKEFINELESVAFSLYPELKEIKNYLYSQDALYVSMSGSGSSIYGVFKKKQKINKTLNCWIWEGYSLG
jgi:4-diphosphocytidyl-2-C-methyl-D-erythritol kinase